LIKLHLSTSYLFLSQENSHQILIEKFLKRCYNLNFAKSLDFQLNFGEVMEERSPKLVATSVKAWLDNPISRASLKFICGKTENGETRLSLAIKKYLGEYVPNGSFADKVACKITKLMIEKGAKAFGVSEKDMKEILKDDIMRRALTNVLEGIAYYGVRKPQITIAPFLVVWNFTHACNLRCKHCYQDAGSFFADELTTEEAKRVIDDFYEAGVVAIAFSGGEPLLRKDFFEVAKYASEKGFYLALATNGTLLTKKIVKRLKETGIEYVEISLDGFEEEHDNFRGIKGAWRRTCEGIKNCVEEGIDTCVATTITKHNYKNIKNLVDFVEKELKAKRFIAFNFIPTRRGKEIITQDIEPEEREELQEFLYSRLIESKCRFFTLSTAPQYARVAMQFGEGPFISTHFANKSSIEMMQGSAKLLGEFIGGCGAGRLYCGLEPNGDVQPCVFIPIKIGNVREKSIKEIWNNSIVLKKMRERDAFIGCGKCEYRYICGGCRARAYAYFDDVQAPDPGCINNKKYWELAKRGEKIKIEVRRKKLFFF
jgi:radical SAM protein with 4Fe4S-binding SPASM domain